MKWILLVLLILVLLGAAGAGLRLLRRLNAQAGGPPTDRRRCLRCRGTGWQGGQPERTLDFTGDGFADRHTQQVQCPDCGGTGYART